MRRTTLASRATAPLLLFLLAPSPRARQCEEIVPYELARDNVEGPWVNLNAVPIRPMALVPGEGDSYVLYAVNTHASTVERFEAGTTAPTAVWGVPWSPVSIGLWDSPGAPRLVVACRGSNAVVQIDPADGEITEVLDLGAGIDPLTGLPDPALREVEPGDLLVIGDHAWVTCTSTDSIVEIDLATNAISRRWKGPAFDPLGEKGIKSPLFLSYDAQADRVLVAPLTSGNGSTLLGGTIQDTTAWAVGLPDEDLFAIDRLAGTVTPVLNGTGTILFAHAVHPDGSLWQLGTDAFNAGPSQVGEPELRGNFSENQVAIAPPAAGAWGAPAKVVLDETMVGGDPGYGGPSVGQPYALAFLADGSKAFVCGLLTDNVAVLDHAGGYLGHWSLPDGSIPRGLAVHEGETKRVYVYCWGTNEIRVYRPSGTFLGLHELAHDPTPEAVKRGREIFYDAHRSENQNVSCATCHVEGRTDLLAWDLSNLPVDDKGPMFTQTLASIERLAPFHWRGERPTLADFNVAFEGLLGGAQLSEGDLADFQAFVFSIQSTPNPFQNRERVLDQNVPTPGVSPTPCLEDVQGTDFGTIGSIGINSCGTCHAAPTGTVNDVFQVVTLPLRPQRSFLKPAPFHELWRKNMPKLEVDPPTGPKQDRPFLGFGFLHDGEQPNLHTFLSTSFGNVDTDALTALLHQWDQGLAPATRFATLLDQDSEASGVARQEIGYLHSQAVRQPLNANGVERRFCDVAVMGLVDDGTGNLVQRRWAFDPDLGASGKYRCEDPLFGGNGTRTLAAFLTGAEQDGERNVFVGLPAGMGERFAIDYDGDGLFNLDPAETDPWIPFVPTPSQIAAASPPSFVHDPDETFPPTTRVTRLAWETDQPTKATVTYTVTGGSPRVKELDVYSKVHSVVLDGLRASTAASSSEYDMETVLLESWQVDVTSIYGKSASFSWPPPMQAGSQTAPFLVKGAGPNEIWVRQSVIGEIDLAATTVLPGGWAVQVDATAFLRRGSAPGSPATPAPAADRALVFAVFHRAPGGDWEHVTPSVAPDPCPAGGPCPVTPLVVDTVELADSSGTPFAPSPTILEPSDQASIVTSLTKPDGSTSFTFLLSSSPPDDEILPGDEILVFPRAIVRVPPAAKQGGYLTQDPSSSPFMIWGNGNPDEFNQFTFAETTEPVAMAIVTLP